MLLPPLRTFLPIFLVLGLLAILAALAKLFLGKRSTGSTEASPFLKKDYLLSAAERSFFEVLLHTLGTEFHVFCKVRMEDIVRLPKGTANRQAWVNKVRQKHVDFLLCGRQKVGPVLVIELDDASHERESARERDAVKDEILTKAGFPILRVKAQRAYDTRELRRAVEQKLGGNGSSNKGHAETVAKEFRPNGLDCRGDLGTRS